MRTGSLSRHVDHQRKADRKCQYDLERAAGRRARPVEMSDRVDDEHEELPDEAPPGWGRSER